MRQKSVQEKQPAEDAIGKPPARAAWNAGRGER